METNAIDVQNIPKNLNTGWLIVIAILIIFMIVDVVFQPAMTLGFWMYGAFLAFVLMILALK
jgi:Na+-transporting NADH:ubiquinone oxidoreductase subunit NqrB